MAHGFKSYYIFFFNNWRAWEKTMLLLSLEIIAAWKLYSQLHWKQVESEACIGFLASCAPESFYDWGDFF